MDAIVAGATGIMASPYILGAAAPWITTTFAPGTVGGNILGDTAGMIAIDETSKALTGRTTGQHIGDALGLAEDSNWRYAVDFANPINIAGPKLLNRGISSGVRYAGKLSKDLENAFKPAIDFYKSGRLRGMYDAAKYGLYDRAQGLYIYGKMPSAKSIHAYDPYSEAQNPGLLKFNKAKEQVSLGTATPLETRLAESSPTGITIGTFKGTPMVHDNESRSFTFFSPCNYLNREGFGNFRKSWDQRSWRLGFTPGEIGFPLPKSLVEASRGAIQKAPSGSFIGADAEYLTTPQSIERVGILRTMIEGFNTPVRKGLRENIPDGLKLYSAEQLQATPSKQFVKFQERPSKLTKKELLGIPKGERNQPLNTHLKGDNAVIMFKEYGSDVTIPDSSVNYNILLKYVPEARERYGIIGRKDISDEEIAKALYKRIQELSKETEALNEVKEPQLLFRGDTRNYNSLKIRMTPAQLIDKKGTMDNSLGTLFLGEYPGTLPDRYDAVGVTRYLSGKVYNPIINEWQWRASSTTPTVPANHTPGYRIFFEPSLGYRGTPIGFVKDLSTAQYPNHLNAFIVKTPYVRDATKEISVLGDDAIIAGFDKAQYRGEQILDRTKDYSDSEIRKLMGDHYTQVLKDAEAKQQGLLRSDAGSPLREEHKKYTYFVVPNFNRFNVKHILPYDLRIPVDWSSHNIYRKNGGKLIRYFK